MWLLVFVIAASRHFLATAIGAAVLALGLLAMKVRPLGYAMTLPRGFGALVMLVIAAANATALLVLSVAAAASAIVGFTAARASGEGRQRDRTRHPHSERFDEVGSAILHFTFVGLVIVGAFAHGGVAAAAGFALYWIVITWGTIAVHEAGHAVAALRTGNDVPNVRIGVGLTLFRVGRISIGAIPFVGHTHWAPNQSSMTSRREAYIALGGPAANLVVALALLSIPFVRTDGSALAIVGVQVGMALLNLVPFEHSVHGQRMSSDGARALRLFRSAYGRSV